MPDQTVVRLQHVCVVCDSDAWLLLPAPVAGRSMLSDGTVLEETLRKCTCSICGLVQHVDGPVDDELQNYFGSSYALGDRQPNVGFEGERQRLYAEWIIRALGQFRPHSILELGCGNGALLNEFNTRLPCVELAGLESSERAVLWAQKSGLPVHSAYVSEERSIQGFSADLVLSVNVIEHSPCPSRFLRAAKSAVRNKGLVLVICPNGLEVGSELLIYDHLYSFCPSNLVTLVKACGLIPVDHQRSPSELPGFQMMLAGTEPAEEHRFPMTSEEKMLNVLDLHAARVSYLNSWKDLDAKLCDAIAGHRTVVMFGLGEMAQLIRAYAPSAWERVSYFVVDHPVAADYFGRPVLSYAELKTTRDELVVLAVSPRSAEKLSARLRGDGHRVLPLDELLAC